MKLNRITLSAFGSFAKETTIDFQQVQGGIFLISGDTGAGKTTILDGISYALFEETSGGIRDGAMMRSQYADSSTPTFVKLEFEYHDETYQICRNPAYKRTSKRKDKDGNEKLTDEPAKVTLTLPDGTEFRGRKEETNQKIVEIMGITAKQFSSIAMIAQGKFTRLLFASSKERREIFARLFDTEIYGRVQNRLAELTGKLERQVKEQDIRYQSAIQLLQCAAESPLEPQWRNINKEALNDSIEEILNLVSLICQETGQAEQDSRAAKEEQRRYLEKRKAEKGRAETELEWIQKRNQAEERKQELLSRQEEITELRLRIREGEQARKLKPEYDSWQEKELECKKQQEESQEAVRQLGKQEKKVQQVKANRDTLAEESRQRLQELEPMLNRLQDSMQQYQELTRVQEKYTGAKTQAEETEGLLEQSQIIQKEIRDRIHELEAEHQRLGELAAKEAGHKEIRESSRRELEAVTAFMDNWQEWIGKLRQKEEQQEAFQLAEAEWKQAKTQYDDALEIYLRNQAGVLAKDLKEQEPCPVCGSLEHPHLAEFRQENLTLEEVEEREQKREQTERGYRFAAESYRTWQTEIRQQMAALSREGFRLGIPDWFQAPEKEWEPDASDIEDFVSARTEALEVMRIQKQETLSKADEQWKQAAEAGRKQGELETERKACQTRLEEQQGKEQEYRSLMKGIREQMIALQEQEKHIRKTLLYPGEAEAAQVLEQGRLEQEKWQEQLEEAEQCYRDSQAEWKRLEGIVSSKQQEVKRLGQEAEQRHNQWKEVWKQTDFESISEYQEKEGYIASLEQWRAQIQQYESDLAVNQSEYRNAKEQAGEKEFYSLEPLEQKIQEAEQKGKELEGQWQQAASIHQNNQGCYQQLQGICKEYQTLVKQWRVCQTLNRTANGTLQGKSKLDFQTYIQRYYFEQMIRAANQRMADMTNGALYLQCRAIEALQIKGEAGLDLDVYSTELNQVRDVKSLSGGESFQAALAMALGMSDVIQETVGRIQMDTLFIDEGFGSLDDDARRMAIEKLHTMTGGCQTVGIISHVSELREEVTHKLYVKKDKQGSHVYWE